ncbi:arginine repressor [Nanchangia anserum]|uniref:arginine repressor n=1 Tax=Nanchangia anserum TaxID=2692125 RepID=UPI001D0F5FB1|nr:hypothetical protein [Nanchangia anserum]
MDTPNTKAARQALIVQVISQCKVRSQAHLLELLAEHGISVTQATISRDLYELHATKLRMANGVPYYAFPQMQSTDAQAIKNTAIGALATWSADLLVSSVAKDNFLVLRTPAGGAQLFASTIDNARLDEVLGCVAGDDTILVICASDEAAATLNTSLLRLAMGEIDAID